MSALKTRLVELIKALGPLPVTDYMAACLFDPKHGYYMSREPFGRGGDFITAPEISQMFGELIATWLIAAWRELGRPPRSMIAEIGPGRGTLMKDVARTIGKLEPALSESGSFHLIETSERLSHVQAAMLEESDGPFTWHSTIDELPRRPLFIVGNELFDAVPIRQYVKTGQGWRERCVGLDAQDDFVFLAGAGSLDPALLPPDASAAPQGALFEIAPARSALMEQIASRIASDTGAGLFIDYGHLETGIGDTLQAVRSHRYDDPLAHPGEADLTSHVDFAALADAVRSVGLDPEMTSQGLFLLEMGLLERAGQLGANAGDAVRNRLQSEVERLAGPQAMGELFKVISFSSNRRFAAQPAP